jgi:hypothetical protein
LVETQGRVPKELAVSTVEHLLFELVCREAGVENH